MNVWASVKVLVHTDLSCSAGYRVALVQLVGLTAPCVLLAVLNGVVKRLELLDLGAYEAAVIIVEDVDSELHWVSPGADESVGVNQRGTQGIGYTVQAYVGVSGMAA